METTIGSGKYVTINNITIKANYNSLTDFNFTNNTANCSASSTNNWEVVTPLSISQVSDLITTIYSSNNMGTSRTSDTTNIGHFNHDVSVYQWCNFGKFDIIVLDR